MSSPPKSTTRRPLIACLGYHDVTDDPTESGFQRNGAQPFKLGVRLFCDHLDRVAAAGQAPGLVTDLDLTRPGRHLLLTFDDGGKSAIRIAAELDRRGWLGHFFITTSLIGRRTFLDAGEIRGLRAGGHLVGTHSHTHPDIYRELEPERMLVEWRQSSDILAQILGEPCLAASVPGGEISNHVLRSAGAAGLRHLFTSEPWLTPRVVGGCWILGRYCPKLSTAADEIDALVHFEGWANKLVVRRLKSLASRSLPSLYRLYVRRSSREWQEQAQ
ncbi:MAG: polysaccharide deacetylase family protein [Gemmatimonadales bacterium]